MSANIVALHTHDRISFKRCRRKWDFSSPLRQHLAATFESKGPLWFGTGMHYALEDYHGWQKYHSPLHAFQAYYNAFAKTDKLREQLPFEHEEFLELACDMLSYYVDHWEPKRHDYETLWIDGVPQVEVEFSVELPELSTMVGKRVVYQGKLDRVVVDEHGRLFIEDYKNVTQFDIGKLETDPQISAYCFAAEQHYGMEFEGMLYTQFKKTAPKPPKILKGGELSVDKRQSTTHALVKAALVELGFGPGVPMPAKYIDFLNDLAEQESFEGDRFIRRDIVRRNQFSKSHEYLNIVMEGCEMLTPSLPIYPNPTRDCAWDCQFRSVCLAMSDGSDWMFIRDAEFEPKGDEADWLSHLDWQDPELVKPKFLQESPPSALPSPKPLTEPVI